MNKYVCVHGHFYQPPRENPWLEAIEPQDSAAPYHDWNARISAECYEPNTASRILDDEDWIVSIVNNYSRISFNFGPTLLSWMEHKNPSVYRAILSADRESRARFGGHGSALAQAYNHVILPLANDEDKALQVLWGLRDFEHRFGRKPEGMWLPETAVDLGTLEALAAHDIRFTVLAPSQAARIRPMGASGWTDVSDARIDPSQAYVQRLPSGKSVALFFYDGVLSRGVAFEGLLHRGGLFAARLAGAVPDDRPRLSHIATDGESYGHHHPHGDMALAYALHAIESRGMAELTNYGAFLERFPPEHEVEIFDNTAWSCAHGIERWRSDCGCHTGGPGGFNQSWRGPLRAALDQLRVRALAVWEAEASGLFREPSEALDHYIDVILDRSRRTVDDFVATHVSQENRVPALKLLEMRRQLQLMYTSCGWFFSDLAGIETVQILQYAGRAVQLAEDLSQNATIEDDFLGALEKARSNHADAGSGRDIYEKSVKPSKFTWEMLGAHYAISSVFEGYPDTTRLYCYDIEREQFETFEIGQRKLGIGCARLTSTITGSSERLSFAVLHEGNHEITAEVRRGRHGFEALKKAFHDNGTLDRYFGDQTFGLSSLFGDEQRRIVDVLTRSGLKDAEATHRSFFAHHQKTMRFLAELGVPPSKALSVAAEVVFKGNLRRALVHEPIDPETVSDLLRNAIAEGVPLDEAPLVYVARESLHAKAERFFESPENLDRLEELRRSVAVMLSLPFEVDLRKVQNLYFRFLSESAAGSSAFQESFRTLGEQLSIRHPRP